MRISVWDILKQALLVALNPKLIDNLSGPRDTCAVALWELLFFSIKALCLVNDFATENVYVY